MSEPDAQPQSPAAVVPQWESLYAAAARLKMEPKALRSHVPELASQRMAKFVGEGSADFHVLIRSDATV